MRNISDLKRIEGCELWNEIMPQIAKKPFMGEAYHFAQDGDIPERFVFMSGVERLGIQFDGKIWADSDLSPIEIDINKAKIFLKNIGIETEIWQNQKTKTA